jgi:hypothetical protein
MMLSGEFKVVTIQLASWLRKPICGLMLDQVRLIVDTDGPSWLILMIRMSCGSPSGCMFFCLVCKPCV